MSIKVSEKSVKSANSVKSAKSAQLEKFDEPIKPAGIIELIRNTAKYAKNRCIYLSILSMRKVIILNHGSYNTDPEREKHVCNGGKGCFMRDLDELYDYLVVALIVQSIEKPLVFNIKTSDDHTIQNCEITYKYLQYVCQNFRTKDKRLNNKFIGFSDELYNTYSDKFDESGYGPREGEEPIPEKTPEMVPGSMKVLARGKPVIKGMAFSEVLKSGIQNTNLDVPTDDDCDFDDIIAEIDDLREERDSYKEEVKECKNKITSLESVLQEQEALIKKLQSDLLIAKTKLNKFNVMIGSIKKNVSKPQ